MADDPEMEAWVRGLLEKTQTKNFVQRILNPNDWPVIDAGHGKVLTHEMAWATVDGRPIAYPTIVYDPDTRGLKKLVGREATNYALRTGEYIAFPDEGSADVFTREYKRLWGKRFQ